MNSASITRGSTSGGSILTKGILFAVCGAINFWAFSEIGSSLLAISGMIFMGLGIHYLVGWSSFRKGHWIIEWDGSHVVIKNGNHIDYDGNVSDMHQVDQDGRGYFLYPTKNIVYRLRRGQSSDDLEAVLDKTQEAQQVASSNC